MQSNVASIMLSFRRKQFNSAEVHVFFILIGGATLLIASRISCLATVVNFGRNKGSKACVLLDPEDRHNMIGGGGGGETVENKAGK